MSDTTPPATRRPYTKAEIRDRMRTAQYRVEQSRGWRRRIYRIRQVAELRWLATVRATRRLADEASRSALAIADEAERWRALALASARQLEAEASRAARYKAAHADLAALSKQAAAEVSEDLEAARQAADLHACAMRDREQELRKAIDAIDMHRSMWFRASKRRRAVERMYRSRGEALHDVSASLDAALRRAEAAERRCDEAEAAAVEQSARAERFGDALATRNEELDVALRRAEAAERDWYAAKTEFGQSMSKMRDRVRDADSRAEAELARAVAAEDRARRLADAAIRSRD